MATRGRKPQSTAKKATTATAVTPKELETFKEEVKQEIKEEVKFGDSKEISQTYTPEKKVDAKKAAFEAKDRIYKLKGDATPVIHILKSRRLMWYDEEMQLEREVMFTENQKTPFVDEFNGVVRPAHIIFHDGVLIVPKEKRIWQLILSKYHPDLGKKYYEKDAEAEAKDELAELELQADAIQAARSMDITKAEAIVRTEVGSAVNKMTAKEIKRDLLVLASKDPEMFMSLAEDENVESRNVGIKGVEQGLLRLSDDNRTFYWASNNRKLFTVPFDEHPYSALTAWFKTDEGLDVYSQLEKRLI